MNYTIFSRFILTIFFISSATAGFTAEEQLTRTDVHRVMTEMLSQHVDKKDLTGDILKTSLKTYMDQFDPSRVYLLETEVNHFLDMNKSQLDQLLVEYKANNYSKFEELNGVIQNAINRSRQIRKELTSNSEVIFQKSSSNPSDIAPSEDDKKISYPSNIEELKIRIEKEIILFISAERKRFGDMPVLEKKDQTLKSFDRLISHRENQYLFFDEQGRPLPPREKENLLVMHILKALARSLDSHSSYLNSDEAFDMKVRLEKGFKGIGIILQKKHQGIVISRMIKDSPAERSKAIKVDDLITVINGENVEGYTLEELIGKLRDDSKQTVSLVLKRPDKSGTLQTINVSLKRELIAVDEGRVDVLVEPYQDGIIGVLRLGTFYQGANGVTSEKDIRDAITKLKNDGHLRGIILDLRENSGGFLNQAVKVAGLFITNGVVVISKYSNGEEHFYRDMDGKTSFDGPLIVLTSKATASAAEIVAQALQDYGVAVIVGDEQTYGKGTIQSQTVTDNKSASHFKVTVGKYYTVSGQTPQKKGVKADIVVPSHYNKEILGEEYLDNALASDTISAAYQDQLTDVEKGLKPWYIRYYMPTLQKKETTWKDLLPALRQESQRRMTVNQEYKKYLTNPREIDAALEADPNKIVEDPQVKEAVSILKDMINLEKNQHGLAETKRK